jgi:hypothetical protein
MDPYLEDPAFWPDFHARFVMYCCESIADRLPDDYEARIDEQINLLEWPAQRARRIRPDVEISDRCGGPALNAAPAAVATLEPTTIPLVIEEEIRETHIEILHRPERTLVSVIELLSPTNKQGAGRSVYLAKRGALLLQDVHLIEVDLLLGGQRLPLEWELPPGDYYALVSRAERRPNCDVYAWPLQHRLPLIPIPLRTPDPDVILDLAAVFATTYERGRYGRSLDYASPPKVPLTEEQRRVAAPR